MGPLHIEVLDHNDNRHWFLVDSIVEVYEGCFKDREKCTCIGTKHEGTIYTKESYDEILKKVKGE